MPIMYFKQFQLIEPLFDMYSTLTTCVFHIFFFVIICYLIKCFGVIEQMVHNWSESQN